MTYSKYSNKKTEVDGILFDSKAEAKRYIELQTLQNLGAIEGLERQKKYILCKGRWHDGKPFSISYVADFVYYDKDGNQVVEDTKGLRLPDYILKKKMMLALLGIEIHEI